MRRYQSRRKHCHVKILTAVYAHCQRVREPVKDLFHPDFVVPGVLIRVFRRHFKA